MNFIKIEVVFYNEETNKTEISRVLFLNPNKIISFSEQHVYNPAENVGTVWNIRMEDGIVYNAVSYSLWEKSHESR